MAVSRRNFIAAIGGGVALVGGLGVWNVTRMPQSATLPWQIDPKPLADVRLDAFRYAILAPNPHNRQPWLIRLVGDDEALISCDPDKRLPETDPFDRQITIGFGTFIELARIAAAERGYRMEITPFPDGEAQPRLNASPVARLRFVADAAVEADPLFAAIGRRRSNKEPYDMSRPVPALLAMRIAGENNHYLTGAAAAAPCRKLILDAVDLEQHDRAKFRESVDLMRIGHYEIDASPDGIDIGGPMIEALKLGGLISRQQLADPQSTAFQSGLDMLREVYGSVPALVWVKTPGNSRLDQLEAGRRYVRANLRATAQGLSMHPMSQALQEYPEMAKIFAAMQATLGATGEERVQMLARIGYGPAVAPSPRWPLRKHIV